ncbi:hypothetical protein [Paraburkholderia sp. JPY465]|uniref:hypothetical protein n=1 Tax=Paraburkholderia sp. JPY465 TaxID=3042285 RepID=UPI003D23F43E
MGEQIILKADRTPPSGTPNQSKWIAQNAGKRQKRERPKVRSPSKIIETFDPVPCCLSVRISQRQMLA